MKVGKLNVTAIYDSGSQVSLLNHKLIDILKVNLMNNKSIFKSINGVGYSVGRADIKLKIGMVN